MPIFNQTSNLIQELNLLLSTLNQQHKSKEYCQAMNTAEDISEKVSNLVECYENIINN